MNLENYKAVQLVAVKNIENGNFTFVCQANKEGIKACEAQAYIGNKMDKCHYAVVYFSAWLKKEYIEVIKF